MNFFKKIATLSTDELKSVASLCGGAALLVAIALVLSGSLPFLPQSWRVAISETGATSNAAAAAYWPYVYSGNGSGPACGTASGPDDTAQSGFPVPHACPVITSLNSGACYPLSYGCSNGSYPEIGPYSCLYWGTGTIGVASLSTNPTTGVAAYTRQDGQSGVSGSLAASSGTTLSLNWSCQDYQNGATAEAHSENYCSASGSGGWTTGTISDNVSVTGPGVSISSGALIGSTDVTLSGASGSTLTYTVACKLVSTVKGTMTLQVTISNILISANPQTVTPGGSSTVSYQTESVDSNSCTVAGPSGTIMTSIPAPIWTQRTISGSYAWNGIASSADGIKLVAVSGGGYLYTSADSGVIWVQRTISGSYAWSGVASSADGIKLVAVNNGGYVYTSADSGLTWTQQSVSGSYAWSGVASSADGTKLVAVSNGGTIYTGVYNGTSWAWTQQSVSAAYAWNSVASSADGTKLVVGSNGSYIYTSTDSGATWTQQTAPGARYWHGIASSADGTKIVTASGGSGYYVYTYQNDYGTVSGAYNATNITSPQTYTISCTLNGNLVSASTTVRAANLPTATISINGGANGANQTAYAGDSVTVTATYATSSGDTLAASAINGTDQINSVPCAAVTPYNVSCWTQPDATKTYTFTPVAGTYSFYAAAKTTLYTTFNNYKSVTLTVLNQDLCTDIAGTQNSVPSGCQTPSPSPGVCIPASKTYDSSSGSCVLLPSVISAFSVTPTRVRKNTPTTVTFTWSGSNLPAEGCSISGTSISGATSPRTASITVAQNTVYTLTCGTATKQATVGLIPSVREI